MSQFRTDRHTDTSILPAGVAPASAPEAAAPVRPSMPSANDAPARATALAGDAAAPVVPPARTRRVARAARPAPEAGAAEAGAAEAGAAEAGAAEADAKEKTPTPKAATTKAAAPRPPRPPAASRIRRTPLRLDVAAVSQADGLVHEVRLLRAAIRRLADEEDATPHVKTLAELRHQVEALCTVLKTQHTLDGRGDDLSADLARALEELGDELGVPR